MESCGAILIIDDNQTGLASLKAMLESLGYGVTAVLTGIDGLFAVGSRNFDLVLLDLILPDISGFEVLARIRESRSMTELPVIMLTSVTGSGEVVEALNRGANDYVTKPYDPAVIRSRIRTQISLKKTEEALRLSEERYTLAARATRDGLWDWRLDSDSLYVSENWKAILGINGPDGEFDPGDWLSRIHPADNPFFMEKLEALREGAGERLEIEYRLRHADGHYRWVQTAGMACRDRGGAVTRLTGSLSDITRNKYHNSLTGLPNAALMEDRIEKLLHADGGTEKGFLCLVFLDLDRFRFINQAYGTPVGDHLLKELATRLRLALRSGETLFHAGRDEFLVLIESPGNAGGIAERITQYLDVIRTPFLLSEVPDEIVITASAGVALSGGGTSGAGQLVSDAESAMNQAKKSGRNGYHFFQEEYARKVREHLSGEKDLVQAIKRDELVMFYQPQLSVSDGSLLGFEALIRWNSPVRGLVMPDRLIPLAEENGLIIPLGEWVVNTVCQQIRYWEGSGLDPRRVAVNLSPLQFRDKSLGESLSQILTRNGTGPERLELEITETKAMENPLDTIKIMRSLRDMGLTFSLDDFGTGYSSLALLQKFPLSTLKIDRAFIAAMSGSSSGLAIVGAIVALARNLGFFTIAEGVETAEQLSTLKELGCGGYQGYLHSPAISAEEATRFLKGLPVVP